MTFFSRPFFMNRSHVSSTPVALIQMNNPPCGIDHSQRPGMSNNAHRDKSTYIDSSGEIKYWHDFAT
jgi:hypothetical protein